MAHGRDSYILPSTFSPGLNHEEAMDFMNARDESFPGFGTNNTINEVSPVTPRPASARASATLDAVVSTAESRPDTISETTPESNATLPKPAVVRRARFHEMLSQSSSGTSEGVASRGSGDDTSAENQVDPNNQKSNAYPGSPMNNTELSSDSQTSSDDEDQYNDLSAKYGQPPVECHSRRDVHVRRMSWLYFTLVALSVYGTLLSGLWLVVSIYQPRYGRGISSGQHWQLTPSGAQLLCTLLSKTIELSFVTVFVAVLGQVLTRRAFVRRSRGVSLAEMTMRNWVIQPGSLLTRFGHIPHIVTTFLGCLTLTSTLCALLYTTASDALVSPKQSIGDWQMRKLEGLVQASYANPGFVETSCRTPIDGGIDPSDSASSCLAVQYSGLSYHNLLTFMDEWAAIRNKTNNTDDIPPSLGTLGGRPTGKHNLYDNTTLESSWIETGHSNISKLAADFGGRIINNVTLSMPHPGVYAAATDPRNGILQPDDLLGLGEYSILASVASPTVNVLCANLDRDELAPLVVTEWPSVPLETTEIPGQKMGGANWTEYVPLANETGRYINSTAVDDVFRWGKKYGRPPPVFPMYPLDYNSITNSSDLYTDALYLLAKGPPTTPNYTLCELRSWVTDKCSSHFNLSGISGGYMKAHCEDDSDLLSYRRANTTGAALTPPPTGDWKNLANEWRLSINLNSGEENANASNARILANLIVDKPMLNPRLPSMAEALAVLASSTLVTAALRSTYQTSWPYGDEMELHPGVYEAFLAKVQTQQYASTHTDQWQAVFYPVLALVFMLNIFCMCYLIFGGGDHSKFLGLFRRGHSRSQGVYGSAKGDGVETTRTGGRTSDGLVTDYTEPENMFALALNSPASAALAGSCGHGPERREMTVPWRVGYHAETNHYFFDEARGNTTTLDPDETTAMKMRKGKGPRSSQTLTTSRAELLGEEESGGPRRSGQFTDSYKRLSSSRMWL